MASDVLSRPVEDKATVGAAQRYVQLAEEAMALTGYTDDPEQRAAICRISEIWLALAEAELRG